MIKLPEGCTPDAALNLSEQIRAMDHGDRDHWYIAGFKDARRRAGDLASDYLVQQRAMAAELDRAKRALVRAGFQDLGGEEWQPPLGKPPVFNHPDDSAVDRFAAAMKAKMADSRAKGRSGWDNEALCPAERLQAMLCDHVAKGDPVDVGNFAMMLFNRGAPTSSGAGGRCTLQEHCRCGDYESDVREICANWMKGGA